MFAMENCLMGDIGPHFWNTGRLYNGIDGKAGYQIGLGCDYPFPLLDHIDCVSFGLRLYHSLVRISRFDKGSDGSLYHQIGDGHDLHPMYGLDLVHDPGPHRSGPHDANPDRVPLGRSFGKGASKHGVFSLGPYTRLLPEAVLRNALVQAHNYSNLGAMGEIGLRGREKGAKACCLSLPGLGRELL
jgi:hypothetical protein